MRMRLLLLSGLIALAAIVPPMLSIGATNDPLVVYSARKDELIKPLFDQFTKETGIPVKNLNDESLKLITRIEAEGANSPADMLITVDAATLILAAEKNLLAPVQSDVLEKNIPASYRDPKGAWFGLSKRVRAIFYNKDKVKPEELSTYEELADPKWKGRLLVRSSGHVYNQSLLSSMITSDGMEATQAFANGIAANLARTPEGGDLDQLRAIMAGEGDVAIANSYYYARQFKAKKAEDKAISEKVAIFFPNQHAQKGQMKGAHVNISGAGVVATSRHKETAQKLIEFLSSPEAQRYYADVNMEYPVNPAVKPDPVLEGFGAFKEDGVPLADLAKHIQDSVKVADKAGWK